MAVQKKALDIFLYVWHFCINGNRRTMKVSKKVNVGEKALEVLGREADIF
jgi:hypothetical protein